MLVLSVGCEPSPALDFSFHAQETDSPDFPALQTYPVGNIPTHLATGDFNNDGFLDVAVVNRVATTGDALLPADPALPGTLSVLLNDGRGGLVEAAAFFVPEAGIRPTRVLVGHLNGDALPDLAYLHGDNARLTVLLNDGGTGWGASPQEIDLTGVAYQVALLDLNGDSPSALDIVFSLNDEATATYVQGMVVHPNPNDGTGAFAAVGVNTPLWHGDADTATDEPSSSSHPTRFVTGKFHALEDAVLDLAVLNPNGDRVNILLGDGKGGFGVSVPGATTANTIVAGDRPHDVVVLDFNGDGFSDLAVSNRNGGTVSILEGDNAGNFSKPSNSTIQLSGDANRPEMIVAGNFTPEGVDIAVVDRRSARIAFINGNGQGGFTEETLAVSFDPFELLVADIDGDGNSDLVSVERGLRVVSVLAGDGAGGFSRTVVGLEHFAISPVLADLDNNGTPDLLLLYRDADTLAVMLNCHPAPGEPCP